MAEIILKFDADEERNDARTAIDAEKWKSAMWDLDQELRNVTKYNTSVLGVEHEGGHASDIEVETVMRCRELLSEILESYGLDLLS